MWFHKVLMLAALLVVNASTAWTQCPTMCTCSDNNAFCDNAGLQHPPPGYWPNIKAIWLNGNNISYIAPNFLSGFPNIEKLYVKDNPLKEVDISIILTNPKIFVISFEGSSVNKIIPLSEGQQHDKLSILDFPRTNLSTIPDDLFRGLRWAGYLDLSGTPMVLPGDRPFLKTNNLQILDLTGVDARNINNLTFSEISSNILIYLRNSRISDIGNAFTSMPGLNTLYLDGNPIRSVKKGSFSKGQIIMRLELIGTLLEEFDVEAVDGILRGTLVINNTPLACQCKFKDLYEWAEATNVKLVATCGNNPPCDFTTI